MSLSLHSKSAAGSSSSLSVQTPFHFAGTLPPVAANEALSESTPLSTIPITVPLPAPSFGLGPPSRRHTPADPVRFSISGVCQVSSSRISSSTTARTSERCDRPAAWSALSSAAKPLRAVV